MKKTFSFNVPNKKRERQVESIKDEVKSYVARERRKKLPENVDYWDFDCKLGTNAETAKVIHLDDIKTSISQMAADQEESFYVEIIVKNGIRKTNR